MKEKIQQTGGLVKWTNFYLKYALYFFRSFSNYLYNLLKNCKQIINLNKIEENAKLFVEIKQICITKSTKQNIFKNKKYLNNCPFKKRKK